MNHTHTIFAPDAIQKGAILPLMEAFYTIQGEGYHQGKAAYFIRLGGCDVGCHWCDVKESWNANDHPPVAVAEIVRKATKYPARLAVITGGEPLMYNLAPLTSALHQAGFKINIETSGAHSYNGDIDWICFSPKKFKEPNDEFYQIAHELKVVIYHHKDFEWAEAHAAQMHNNCQFFLQPEWSKQESMLPNIIEYVKKNPRWQISLQTHKYMNVP